MRELLSNNSLFVGQSYEDKSLALHSLDPYKMLTWSECVKTDMKMCSLGSIDPLNREAWGLGVRHSSHLLPTPVPGTPAAVEK